MPCAPEGVTRNDYGDGGTSFSPGIVLMPRLSLTLTKKRWIISSDGCYQRDTGYCWQTSAFTRRSQRIWCEHRWVSYITSLPTEIFVSGFIDIQVRCSYRGTHKSDTSTITVSPFSGHTSVRNMYHYLYDTWSNFCVASETFRVSVVSVWYWVAVPWFCVMWINCVCAWQRTATSNVLSRLFCGKANPVNLPKRTDFSRSCRNPNFVRRLVPFAACLLSSE
jgi:hypothetical protein